MDLRIDTTLARASEGISESRERVIESSSNNTTAADFSQTLGKAPTPRPMPWPTARATCMK